MAEVKVKITAQNEVRTGLQQALQETQKFSQQAKAAVSQSITTNPFAGDDRLGPLRDLQRQARELRELAGAPIEPVATTSSDPSGATLTANESRRAATAIRGLAADLATAQTPAQAFEAVVSRLAQVMGRLSGVLIGFAAGKLISAQFDKLNAGIESAISNASRFSAAFQSMGNATNFGEAISQFRQLKTGADQTGETLRNLQKDLGATLANIALGGGFKSGGVFGEIAALEEAQRRAAGANLVANTQFLVGQSEQQLGFAGNTEAEQAFERRAKQEQELFALQQELNSARAKGDGQLALDLQNAIDLTRERFEIEDQIAAKRKEIAAERQERNFASSAAQQRTANEDRGRSLEEKLARERQALADLDQFGGAGVELLREQTLGRILTLEEAITAERERQEQQAKQKERAAALERERQIAEEKQKQQQQKSAQEAVSNLRRIGQTPEERQESINKDASRLLAEAGSLQPGDFAGAQDIASRAARIAGELSGLESKNTVGGASDLQRVGLASREFFGSVDDKTTKAVDRVGSFVSKVVEILQNSDGLYIERN